MGKLCLRYARSAHSHETRSLALHARLYDALNTLGVLGADGLEPGHTIHTAGPALHGATLAGHHGNAGLGAEASGIKCDSALRTVYPELWSGRYRSTGGATSPPSVLPELASRVTDYLPLHEPVWLHISNLVLCSHISPTLWTDCHSNLSDPL